MKKSTCILIFFFSLTLLFSQEESNIKELESLKNQYIKRLDRAKPDFGKLKKPENLDFNFYQKISKFFYESGNVYKTSYRKPELRKYILKYLLDFSKELVNQEQPILLIYGIDADSVAIENNKIGNNLNITFIGIENCDCSRKLNKFNFNMKVEFQDEQTGKRQNLSEPPCSNRIQKIIRLISYEKFNENTLFLLEEKYGTKEVLKILLD